MNRKIKAADLPDFDMAEYLKSDEDVANYLTLVLERPVEKAHFVHDLMLKASEGAWQGILGYCSEPLVSADFLGRTESSIYDETQTIVAGELVKLVAWYDNESGFAHRLLDLVEALV